MIDDTARHEAAHAAASIWLRLPVEYVQVETGSVLAGEEAGRCRTPIVDEIGADRLIVAMAGWMAEGRTDWPPSYEVAKTTRLESLDTILRVTGIDEAGYDRAVELASELLEDRDFRRLVDTISRGLRCCPQLDEQAVRELTEAAAVPYPELEGASTP